MDAVPGTWGESKEMPKRSRKKSRERTKTKKKQRNHTKNWYGKRLILQLILFVFLAAFSFVYYIFFLWGSEESRSTQKKQARLLQRISTKMQRRIQPSNPFRRLPNVKQGFSPLVITTPGLSIREYQIDVTGRLSRDVFAAITPLDLEKVQSTSNVDQEFTATFDNTQKITRKKIVPDFFRRVVGAPLLEIPSKPIVLFPVEGTPLVLSNKKPDMRDVLFIVDFHSGKKSQLFKFRGIRGEKRLLINPSLLLDKAAYSFAKYMNSSQTSFAINRNARKLSRAHPDIFTYPEAKVFLHLVVYLMHRDLNRLDLWQEQSACRWVRCKLLPKINKVLKKENVNATILGMTANYPWWVWRIASYTNKYHLSKQGLGPYQLIIGLAEKAIQEKDLAKLFIPKLDVSSSLNLVRAALDPIAGLALKSLSIAHIVRKLKKAIPSQIGNPIDKPPFIFDAKNPRSIKASRKYLFWAMAYHFGMFPEDAPLLPDVAITTKQYFYLNLLSMSMIFHLPFSVPGMFYVKIDFPKEVFLGEYKIRH